MEQEEFKELITDYISDNLGSDKREEFERFLLNNPELINEVDKAKGVWNEIDTIDIPEPSAAMDGNFYSVLNTEMEKVKITRASIWNRLISFFSIKQFHISGVQLAMGVGLLIIGLFIGNQINDRKGEGLKEVITEVNPAVHEAEQETDKVRSELVLVLADQSSANKRLKAVSEVNKLNSATEQVILALFKMLNSDPNINVRLAAITSLSKYVNNPKVREGLVMSIIEQESPLVQIALADLMVTLKEQKSIDSMEKLLEQPDINNVVKQKLEASIKQII